MTITLFFSASCFNAFLDFQISSHVVPDFPIVFDVAYLSEQFVIADCHRILLLSPSLLWRDVDTWDADNEGLGKVETFCCCHL